MARNWQKPATQVQEHFGECSQFRLGSWAIRCEFKICSDQYTRGSYRFKRKQKLKLNLLELTLEIFWLAVPRCVADKLQTCADWSRRLLKLKHQKGENQIARWSNVNDSATDQLFGCSKCHVEGIRRNYLLLYGNSRKMYFVYSTVDKWIIGVKLLKSAQVDFCLL